MKDDAVERVLQGLGRVEVPRGLEGRVLLQLAERDARRATRWVWSFGLAEAMALMGLLAWNFGVFGHFAGGYTPEAKARFVGEAEEFKAEDLRSPPARARTAEIAAAPTRVSEARHGAPNSVARMVSFPAPPLPLTEEEKLLRQIALAGNAPAFELLNEETREAALAASDAEFEAFVRSAPSDRPAAKDPDFQR